MKFNNHFPIYLQIIDLIKREIVLGHIKPGDKLDSVRDYAVKLTVNPNTVQKAYQEMERMSLAFTKRGIGSFIVEDDELILRLMHEMSSGIVDDFIQKMTNLGYKNEEILERIEQALNGGK